MITNKEIHNLIQAPTWEERFHWKHSALLNNLTLDEIIGIKKHKQFKMGNWKRCLCCDHLILKNDKKCFWCKQDPDES